MPMCVHVCLHTTVLKHVKWMIQARFVYTLSYRGCIDEGQRLLIIKHWLSVSMKKTPLAHEVCKTSYCVQYLYSTRGNFTKCLPDIVMSVCYCTVALVMSLELGL